jgi:hypothetical protein
MYAARRKFRNWTKRAQPHLERFAFALLVVADTTPQNLCFVADQVDAASKDFAAYLATDPCPDRTLARIYESAIEVYAELGSLLAAFERMARYEQEAARDRVTELGGKVTACARMLDAWGESLP